MIRRLASILLLAFCGAAPATAPASRPVARKVATTVPADFVEHKLAGCDATLKSPPNWREGGHTGHALVRLVADDGSRANVNVMAVRQTTNADPRADAEQLLKVAADHVDNFVRVSAEVVDVGGLPVARVVYEGNVGGKPLRWQQALVPTPTHAYVMTYAADLDAYPKHERQVEQMLVSFKTGE